LVILKIRFYRCPDFIEELNGHYHEHTYAFYGNDGKNYPSYAELHWKDVMENIP
jgi:hypothetical protein